MCIRDSSSPVVSWTGIRTFLALTTLYNLTPLQMDINLAYLNAPLEEEVYMYPPEGSSTPKGKVWKLNKSLYGLKQSGRNWYKLFTDVLTSQKFKFSQLGGDKCLFTRKIGNETTVLFIYVDDIYCIKLSTGLDEVQREAIHSLRSQSTRCPFLTTRYSTRMG